MIGRCLLAVMVLALLLTGCTSAKKTPPQVLTAQAYLDAFGRGDSQSAAADTTDTGAAATIAASIGGLGATSGTLHVTGLSANKLIASYSASWVLPGASKPWTYNGTLPMIEQDGRWLVSWSSADIYPGLAAGSHLIAERSQPVRAALEASNGTPLFTETPVVTIGVEPAMAVNITAVAASLAAALSPYAITAASIVTAAQAATPTDFVPVLTLRKTAYESIKAKIYNLPGVIFQSSTELLGPSSTFAQPLLGQVGAATKDIVEASKGRVKAGDTTGLSGLQLALDPQLAGTPGVDIYSAVDSTGTVGAKLASVQPATAAAPVKLTLNVAAQNAADAALASLTVPAAIVAMQPSTGNILAVANSTAATDDIALDGQYPPGSTFKIVTYSAVFASKPALSSASPVNCPPTTVVNGQSFENENQFSHGTIPISAAFAYSCNTSAINLAVGLPATAETTAAASLGLGAQWNLPVTAFSGSLPAPASINEQAADAIGQGKVLVSPLLMATIAGAAATGKPVAPSLLTSAPGKAGAQISAGITANMNALMRATVAQSGATAAKLNDLPGNVEGKTGTAEFGTATPPQTHSWFAGTRGDLAFAVFIYGGGSSAAAVSVAHDFLTTFKQ
jgi:cell division protein FtsI/penicillin-binding protein 2